MYKNLGNKFAYTKRKKQHLQILKKAHFSFQFPHTLKSISLSSINGLANIFFCTASMLLRTAKEQSFTTIHQFDDS